MGGINVEKIGGGELIKENMLIDYYNYINNFSKPKFYENWEAVKLLEVVEPIRCTTHCSDL